MYRRSSLLSSKTTEYLNDLLEKCMKVLDLDSKHEDANYIGSKIVDELAFRNKYELN